MIIKCRFLSIKCWARSKGVGVGHGRNKLPKSIERPPAINVNEILISRQTSEVETTLRQFRLKNDKKSRAVPKLRPRVIPSSARRQLEQARDALNHLVDK
jgi:hypothetical protein